MKQRNAIILMIVLTFSHTVMANTKLSEIFAPDMLGSDLAYLEQITGVAKNTYAETRTKKYKVEGCMVEVQYSLDKTITALGLDLSPQCSFDAAPFLGQSTTLPANQLTFGQLIDGQYYADCLSLCGNAYEPSIYKHYEGAHVDNFLEILVSSVSAQGQYEWTQAMVQKEGEDWVNDGKFNCSPQKYNEIAEQFLKQDKIQKITIGYDLLERLKLSDCKK